MVLRPDAHGFIVFRRLCVEAKRVHIKGRTHRFEVKRTGRLAANQLNQQRGNQRAVHDEVGVALHVGHLLAVVMNAVTIAVTGVRGHGFSLPSIGNILVHQAGGHGVKVGFYYPILSIKAVHLVTVVFVDLESFDAVATVFGQQPHLILCQP